MAIQKIKVRIEKIREMSFPDMLKSIKDEITYDCDYKGDRQRMEDKINEYLKLFYDGELKIILCDNGKQRKSK